MVVVYLPPHSGLYSLGFLSLPIIPFHFLPIASLAHSEYALSKPSFLLPLYPLLKYLLPSALDAHGIARTFARRLSVPFARSHFTFCARSSFLHPSCVFISVLVSHMSFPSLLSFRSRPRAPPAGAFVRVFAPIQSGLLFVYFGSVCSYICSCLHSRSLVTGRCVANLYAHARSPTWALKSYGL